ncbi:AarF/ABC1/UbiB kinase family protein [Balneolales bacterium ANBcel1]|nr:AarF/ABC1/UbiB kinase family protein [Balneolales bacterium ANBcel1]
MNDFPSSRFERGSRIARAGLKLGTNYALHRFKSSFLDGDARQDARKKLHAANAKSLYDEFSQLRGTALKLAQTLSLDHGILPEEFADIMSQAQYKVPPIGKALVRQIIKNELGDYPELIFKHFDPNAAAAASIGQVHRAKLYDGRDVVVKIQYPNVRASISSDLDMAKMVFKRIVQSEKTDDYFVEVRERMMEETDYRHEGRQISTFHQRYNGKEFAIPEYLEKYSTARVLTMTAINGEHLPEFLARNPSSQERNRYGQLLWDFFHAQINDSRTLHADAHPGNYLLCSDGRLGVLDFGCVKVCPSDFFSDYVSLLPAQLEADPETLRGLYIRLGLIHSNGTDPDYENDFFELCRKFGELVVAPYQQDRFDFGDMEFGNMYKHLAAEAVRQPEPRGTHHFVYVTRAHVGLYRMLMQLQATISAEPGRSGVMEWVTGEQTANPEQN